jgi:hypothetical protein
MAAHHGPRLRGHHLETFFDQLRANQRKRFPLGREKHDDGTTVERSKIDGLDDLRILSGLTYRIR